MIIYLVHNVTVGIYAVLCRSRPPQVAFEIEHLAEVLTKAGPASAKATVEDLDLSSCLWQERSEHDLARR